MRLHLVASSIALPVMAGAAFAADRPTTQAGADRLLAIAGQFIGTEGTNSVLVTPEPDGYTVRVDVTRLLTPLEKFGFSISQYSQYLKLVEQDDGRWRVSVSEIPTVSGQMQANRYFLLHVDDYRFRGVWDPALAAFTSWEQGFSAMRRSNSENDVTSEYNVGGSSGTETGEAGAAGSATVRARFTFGPIKQVVTAKTPAFTLTMAAESATSEATVQSLHSKDLLDFWSYAIAHANRSTSDLDAFKQKVRAALPLFEHFDQKATVKHMSVGTPVGNFGVGDLQAAWGTSGLVDGGSTALTMALDGISVPQGSVPPWATRLVPTRFSMSGRVSGYDLAGATSALIDSFDPSRQPAVSPDDLERIRAMVAARGPVHVRIDPTELRGAAYDLKVEGDMDFDSARPSGSMSVRMDGLDTVIAAVQSAKDPRAQQAMMSLMMAKALAKQQNGGHAWTVSFHDGAVTVNGKAIGP